MSLSVDIEKKVGNFTLRVKFDVNNETLALFGASGCGKSMTLKCIAGVEKPDKGKIILDGRTLFDSEKHICLSPQKRKVGYLFQQYALFPNMTVEQNIACGIHKHKDPEKVAAMIKAMHLEGMEKKKPSQLSGGQQQRTALARILIGEPDILMLDEPFSALDTHLRYQMEQEVHKVTKSFGKPVLLVSHDSYEVYRLSDRIAIMNDGRIEVEGAKKDIYLNPTTVNGALLTGYRNLSPAEAVEEGKVFAKDWGTVINVEGDVSKVTHIAARTESVEIGEGENNITCIVKEVISNAFSNAFRVVPKNGKEDVEFMIHTKSFYEDISVGSEITVSIPKDQIVLLKS